MLYNDGHYEDILIGGFEYKENQIIIMSSLSDISNPNITGYQHKIYGNTIFKGCIFTPVQDCLEGEKRVSIFMKDLIESLIFYSLVLHKRVVNGQEGLKIFLNEESRKFTYQEGEEEVQATVDLQGEYIFYKQ